MSNSIFDFDDEKPLDDKQLGQWKDRGFPEVSPLQIGDIVEMRMDGGVNPEARKRNKDRLMRVTEVRKDLSQTGWVVIVKVNPYAEPIYDLDGNPCHELRWLDVAWFKIIYGVR